MGLALGAIDEADDDHVQKRAKMYARSNQKDPF
jgi:hypothetical protein